MRCLHLYGTDKRTVNVRSLLGCFASVDGCNVHRHVGSVSLIAGHALVCIFAFETEFDLSQDLSSEQIGFRNQLNLVKGSRFVKSW